MPVYRAVGVESPIRSLPAVDDGTCVMIPGSSQRRPSANSVPGKREFLVDIGALDRRPTRPPHESCPEEHYFFSRRYLQTWSRSAGWGCHEGKKPWVPRYEGETGPGRRWNDIWPHAHSPQRGRRRLTVGGSAGKGDGVNSVVYATVIQGSTDKKYQIEISDSWCTVERMCLRGLHLAGGGGRESV